MKLGIEIYVRTHFSLSSLVTDLTELADCVSLSLPLNSIEAQVHAMADPFLEPAISDYFPVLQHLFTSLE